MSLQIADDRVVAIHYTLTDSEGEQLDSSAGGEPLVYLHGAGNIIPGLENALLGKKAGDSLQVVVQPEDGYGELIEELRQVVSIDLFQGVDELEVGMMFETENEDGNLLVTVTAIEEGNVALDANHPLAGEVLHFDVTVEDVREATAQELEHGHVHGEDCGHDHH